MSTPFDRLLDTYRALSDSKRAQGNYLEALTKNFLQTDGVHSLQYKNVWLWNEWPDRDGKTDNGIDLVVAGHEVVDVFWGGDAGCYDGSYVEP